MVTFVAMADPKVILPYALLVYLLHLYLRRRRRSLLTANEPLISSKTLRIIKTPNSFLQSLHLQNPYDVHTNPEGFILMASDQNHLCMDLINARLKEIGPKTAIAIRNQLHQDHGIPALKNAVSGYITQITGKNVSFKPSRMVITAGAAAAIEILSFCVAEARGNAILVPSPYNPCYDKFIGWRSGVEIVPVPCRSSDDFEITATALDRALRTCKFRRLIPRAILISNPCNPTGNFIHRETLLMILKFAADTQIHVICDETQAVSLQSNPDEFTSVVKIVTSEQKSRVHVIYDLGIPGFNVGVIYTYNDKILEAAQEFARFCSVSFDAQSLLAALLADSRFVEEYVNENRRRVRERFSEFFVGLHRAGVRCVAGGGGVFCWGKMERLLGAYSEKGEAELWEEVVREAKIYTTPGSDCHCIEPGWFRWCFGSVSEEEMAVALRRIRDFVRRRSHRQLEGSVAAINGRA